MRYILFLIFFLSFNTYAQNRVDKQGLKQGKWIKYYSNTKNPIYEGEFKDDKPVGLFTYYSQDGKISARMMHLSDRRTRVEFYHKNGNVLSDGFYYNQLKDSTWYNYAQSGEISSIESFKQDKLHGPSIFYYLENDNAQNPAIMRKSFYLEGQIHGIYQEFFKSGKLKLEGEYAHGIPLGTWKEYSNLGQLSKSYKFKMGKIHGWVKHFNKNGSVDSESFFKEGEPLVGRKLDLYLEECAAKNVNPED